MSRAFIFGVLALAAASAAIAQSVPVRTGPSLPAGVCGVNVSCEVVSLTSTSTVQSDALSGQYAFKASVNGARIGVGGGNAYLWAVDDNTLATNATFFMGGGVDIRNGLIADSVRGSVLVGNVQSLIVLPLGTIATCAVSATLSPQRSQPGGLAVIAGSTGKPHRLCLCTYDGTTYAWQNIATGALGDATTCPEAA